MQEIILSLYPNTSGIGYAVLEMSKEETQILDFGFKRVPKLEVKRIEVAVQKQIDEFAPDRLMLRRPHQKDLKSASLKTKLNSIVKIAKKNNITVERISREEIKRFFGKYGQRSKDEIANLIAEHFSELRAWLPQKREPWLPEHPSMGIFDAVAQILTIN